MKRRISVIVPIYNAEKYIDRCLKSIAAQTYGIKNLEIILVDDASTDNTPGHLKNFETQYQDNVIFIRCEENRRQGAARNIGLDYATGEYVTFVDADDLLDNTMLEKMAEAMNRYDCDVVECGYKQFSDEREAYVEKDIESPYYLDLRDINNRKRFIIDSEKTAVWGRLYKRNFIEDNKMRFVERLFYQDVQFSGISMFLINTYYRINETLYYYYYNEDGTVFSVYKPERVHQETKVMDLFLSELYERNMLKDIMNRYRMEFEAFCTLKCYMDPFHLLVRSNLNGKDFRNEIDYFKEYILDLFPDVLNNQILSSQNEIVGCAFNLLRNRTSAIESLLSNTLVPYLMIVHLNNEIPATFENYVIKHYPDYMKADIDENTFVKEQYVLRHFVKGNYILVINIGEFTSEERQLYIEQCIRFIISSFPENEILFCFDTLYYIENDRCLSSLAKIIDILKKHKKISTLFTRIESYDLACKIIPGQIKKHYIE